jgi:hypothetical protein
MARRWAAAGAAAGAAAAAAAAASVVGAVAGAGAAAPRLLPPRDTSFAALSTPVLATRPIPYDPRGGPGTTWAIEATCCGYGNFSQANVEAASLAAGGLFDLPCGRPAEPIVAEWGYEFFHNQNNIFPTCGNLTMAGYPSPPASRADAAARLAAYWDCRAAAARQATPNATSDSPIFSMPGHYLITAAAAAAGGAGVVGSEIGENINSVNAHLAAARGAARQFGVPFSIDFSAWMQGYILDYTPDRFWGAASSPVGGHSLSLFWRAYVAAFMAGASALIAEAGAVNYFLNGSTTPLPLSPLGVQGAAFYALTHGGVPAPAAGDPEAVRGVPFVPLAILAPADACLGLELFYQRMAWATFPASPTESRLLGLLYDVWPARSFTVEDDIGGAASEVWYMAGGAGGELYDIIGAGNLTDAPGGGAAGGAGFLSAAYAAVIAPGLGVAFDGGLCAALAAYVASGGAVWIAADDVLSAPAGCFNASFVGAALAAPPAGAPSALVTAVTDADTGAVLALNSSALPPTCVGENASTPGAPPFFIQVGGAAGVAGWDGGSSAKCCRADGGDCRWYGDAGACAGAAPLAPVLCVACATDNSTIGCPAWADLPPGSPVPAATAAAAVTGSLAPTARIVLSGSAPAGGGPAIPLLLANAFGAGVVLTSLSVDDGVWGPPPTGMGARAHVLARLAADALPAAVPAVSATWTARGGVAPIQFALNRQPGGWNVTVTNNAGVVKVPDAAAAVDAGEAVVATVAGTAVPVGPGDVAFAFVADP